MTQELAADPVLGRLADAVLIPPFPGGREPAWIRAALADGLAGVTLFGLNIEDRQQLAALTARLRAAAAEPVIAIDEEGGDVTRISHQAGSDYPGNAALGAIDDVELTRSVYAALGADLAGLGINLDLAPAVDVNTAAGNPVIGTRSFGADPDLVARHAAAAVTGLQSAGVAACAKHFPGHGSTIQDSHLVLATIDAPLSVLRSRDLPPFEAAIAAGARAIMPSHLRVPELTGELPASLSRRALTDLLRGELGFTGVIVSDALEMRAVADRYGIPEAAVQAVIAGTDLLCLGRDQDQLSLLAVKTALIAAVRSGRLPGERLEEAAARVAELRSWTAAAAPGAGAAAGAGIAGAGTSAAGTGADSPIGLAAARRAVSVSGTLPAPNRPLVVQLVPPSNLAVGPVPWGLHSYVPAGSYREISTGTPADGLAGAVASILAEARGRTLIIVVRDAHRHPAAAGAADLMLAARPDAVLVEMGLPVWRPAAGGYVATYGAALSSSRAAAEITGLIRP
ncbi:MAG TPA: glycoside hydrolase family 3 N-terminal domain-containing protein [Streptosporangiaceae bacterium]|nr:glycoside hydrolase family 3 N-terminal domain-containing protein [Streptosporangiaceae bacterium]